MLRLYIEKILKIYNLIDDVCIVDKNGIIQYAEAFVAGAYSYDSKELVGKHIFEVYTTSNEKTSNLYEVLKTGKPIFNRIATWKTYRGDTRCGSVDTLPIMKGHEIVGAVEIARFVGDKIEKQKIVLDAKDNAIENKASRYYTLDDIVTDDIEMIDIKNKIRRIARNNSAVMIYGKTGTGKELVAQAIHTCGTREGDPFISQNCAAIPASLLEAILFGTEKGSYTGAENRKGLFELAQGGTLFLDEINSMEIGVQAKILKAVEEKKIMRIGGQQTISVNTRIITGLNEDPIIAMREKRLREDLFYRLCTVQINLPELNDRKGDIKVLVDYFVKEYNESMNMNIKGISKDVERIFMNYKWPGNVRELRNVIEGAFNITTNNYIEECDLPEYLLLSGKAEYMNMELEIKALKDMLENYEKSVVLEAIRITKNKIKAAELLGMSKQSLNYRLEKYKIK
ncbi:MAG TPA: sigma 54-interacting transcriptional regulator [Clostridia bacterium]|nr:sigma 54-interacting transcriptional regulator [Clostridia bacterium]